MFYIHKRVAGRRWKKALDVGTEREALAELVAFDRDPTAFCAGATEPDSQAPRCLDADLVAA